MFGETKVVVVVVCLTFVFINIVLVNKHLPQIKENDGKYDILGSNKKLEITRQEPCSTVFSVLHIMKCVEEQSYTIQKLATYLNLSPNDFMVESKTMQDGLPFHFCAFDRECCERHIFQDAFMECENKNIQILANFAFDHDVTKAKQKHSFSVSWKISKDVQCLSLQSKSILNVLASFESISKDKNLSKVLGCHVKSWTLLLLSSASSHSIVPVYKHFSSRKRRSVPHSPGIFAEENSLENVLYHPTVSVQYTTTLPTTLASSEIAKTTSHFHKISQSTG